MILTHAVLGEKSIVRGETGRKEMQVYVDLSVAVARSGKQQLEKSADISWSGSGAGSGKKRGRGVEGVRHAHDRNKYEIAIMVERSDQIYKHRQPPQGQRLWIPYALPTTSTRAARLLHSDRKRTEVTATYHQSPQLHCYH